MLLLLHACAASSSIHAAAEQGDAHALRAALAAGEGPNTRDADSYTPLHLSAGSTPHRARTPDQQGSRAATAHTPQRSRQVCSCSG